MRQLACIALVSIVSLSGIWMPGAPAQTAAPTATPLRSYGALLQAPARVAIDAANRLYVTDSAAGCVLVRDQYGRLIGISPRLTRPLGIAVDAAGFIYVGEEGAGSVTVFDQSWGRVRYLGRGDGEFGLPNHIAIDSAGMVYVADSAAHVVKKYSPSGQLLLVIGSAGSSDGQFSFPTGVWIAPTGELIVADQDNVRLQIFGSDGTFLRKIRLTSGMLGGGGGRIQGVTVDALGRIYVADAFQSIIRILAPDGTKLSSIGAFGSGPGQLLNPSSVAIDRHNRLFVASVGNARVDVYGIDAFSDPHVIPAEFSMRPATLARVASHGRQSPTVIGFVKVEGYDPTQIVRESLRVNGLATLPARGPDIGDFDDDGRLELRFLVDRAALVGTLANGGVVVSVSGVLDDGMEFEGAATVRVTPAGADVDQTAGDRRGRGTRGAR